MAVALEKKDVHLLQICLQRFPDIPEEITYACLKVFLRQVRITLFFLFFFLLHQTKPINEKLCVVKNGFNFIDEQLILCIKFLILTTVFVAILQTDKLFTRCLLHMLILKTM